MPQRRSKASLLLKPWLPFHLSLAILVLVGICALTACTTKVAKVAKPVTPVAPLPSPTATLSAKPDVIQQGQSTVLTWQTTNATDISIEGLGTVSSSGSQAVAPGASRTYTLTAKGAGGSTEASARITVNPAAAAVITPPVDTAFLKDVFFNFDDSAIRGDQSPITQNDASYLSKHPEVKVLVEGHCDDRGSALYNLALGENRAHSVREALIAQGVDPSRIKTVSYGKEKPFCSEDNETCWQENRRDHFVPQ